MATIRDIARAAGVSVPTVSRVLNGHAVGEALVERVKQAAAALNYVPNRAARRLRGGGSRVWGAIFSDIANPFYTEVLKGLEARLSTGEASLIFGNANSDPEREAKLIRLMREEGAAGLIIAPTSEEPAILGNHVTDGFPIVVVDRRMRDLAVDTVHSNNMEAAWKAVGHLVAVGHRRIGFIGGPHRLSSARERYAGYLRALRDAGLAIEAALIRFGDYHRMSGLEQALILIQLEQPPSAILVANNEMVIGALNAIHAAGCRIPEEIAIVGFDDFPWAISLNPPLTAIAQPAFDMGERAAELLLERVADPGRPARTIIFDTRLVVRASCGSAARRPIAQNGSAMPEQALAANTSDY